MILSFIDYINESKIDSLSFIYYSDDFKDILLRIGNNNDSDIQLINKKLLDIEDNIKSDVSFIDITDNNNYLSFIQANRAYRKWENDKTFMNYYQWLNFHSHNKESYLWKEQRSEIRIGVLVKKLLKEGKMTSLLDKQLEKYINVFKSVYDSKKNAYERFDLVSGELIRKWYLVDNYAEKRGQLGNSCMRYNKCQDFLNIYVKNEDVCKLLILYSDDTKTKISGRALVWTLKDGRIVIDRIYTNNDSDINLFQKYAYDRDWILVKNLKYDVVNEIQLKEWRFFTYPFMDNFMCLNINDGTLSDNEDVWPSKGWIKMQSTDGTYYDDDSVWSEYEGEYIRRDDAVYLSDIGDWGYGENSIWLEYTSEYVSQNADITYSKYTDQTYYTDDTVYSEIMEDSIHKDDAESIQINYYGDEDWIPYNFKNVTRMAVYENTLVKTLDTFVLLDPTTGNYHFKDQIIDGLEADEWILRKIENVEVDFEKVKNYILNIEINTEKNVKKVKEIQMLYNMYLPFIKGDDFFNLIKYLLIYSPDYAFNKIYYNLDDKSKLYTDILKNTDLLKSLISKNSFDIFLKHKNSIIDYIKITNSLIFDIIEDKEIRTMYMKLKKLNFI
jgi:hypothetical protein